MKFVLEGIGEVTVRKQGRGHILTDFYVEPQYRGKGHGSRLLGRALRYADREGLKLTLRVAPYGKDRILTSRELTRFYERHGFVSRGERMIRNPKEKSLLFPEIRI